LLVSLATVVISLVARGVLGKGWRAPRVKVPYRFSLFAIGVLTVIVACVCGLLRDDPAAAMLAAVVALLLWFPIARFQEFQQVLAERRKRALASALDARRSEGKDDA
jgi:high-affinity K+ transport system ATPase subunit B